MPDTGVSCNCFESKILTKFRTTTISRIACKFNHEHYNIMLLLRKICDEFERNIWLIKDTSRCTLLCMRFTWITHHCWNQFPRVQVFCGHPWLHSFICIKHDEVWGELILQKRVQWLWRAQSGEKITQHVDFSVEIFLSYLKVYRNSRFLKYFKCFLCFSLLNTKPREREDKMTTISSDGDIIFLQWVQL